MPESPDFNAIARRIASVGETGSTLKPLTEAIAEQFRQVWNARGAADRAALNDAVMRTLPPDFAEALPLDV